MKLSSLILTLIVLVLNIFPCCAWENIEEGNRAISSGLETPYEEKEDDCKNCSPFYSCGNCTASLDIQLTSLTFPNTNPSLTSFSAELLLSFTEGVADGIWQPPKKR